MAPATRLQTPRPMTAKAIAVPARQMSIVTWIKNSSRNISKRMRRLYGTTTSASKRNNQQSTLNRSPTSGSSKRISEWKENPSTMIARTAPNASDAQNVVSNWRRLDRERWIRTDPKPKFANSAANSVTTVAIARWPKSDGASSRARTAVEPIVTPIRVIIPRKVIAAPRTTLCPTSRA